MITPDPRKYAGTAEEQSSPGNTEVTSAEAVSVLAEDSARPGAAVGTVSAPEAPSGEKRRRSFFRRFPNVRRFAEALLILGAAILAAAVMSRYPEWISTRYVRFSRAAQHVLGSIFGIFPFSFVELLLYAALLAVPCGAVALIVLARKRGGGVKRLARWLSHTSCMAASMLAVFILTWGVNYYSAGLGYSLGLDVHERPAETLRAALEEITLDLAEAEAELPKDAGGEIVWPSFSEQSDIAREAWRELAGSEPYFAGASPVRVKPVAASRALSYMGLTGIFVAFTGEANVNRDFRDSGRIFTMAHELAHSLGCAAENEANFAAYLACRGSSSPYARYSGLLSAFVYCYNQLVGVDREAAFECWYMLPESVVDELHARNAYWQSFEGEIKKAATAVNDGYLKTMAQPSGVKSYGEVVDLILADYDARH